MSCGLRGMTLRRGRKTSLYTCQASITLCKQRTTNTLLNIRLDRKGIDQRNSCATKWRKLTLSNNGLDTTICICRKRTLDARTLYGSVASDDHGHRCNTGLPLGARTHWPRER